MKTYKLSMAKDDVYGFLNCILKGTKKAEGRIATKFVRNFSIGDILLLYYNQNYLNCRIVYLHFYNSFEDMLDSEGFKNMVPFAKDKEQALKIYKGFPGSNRVNSMGCCAIGVKPVETNIKPDA